MNMHRALRFSFFAAMVTMIAFTLVLGAMASSVSAAIGDWEGKIDTGNGSLHVLIHISQAADGKLTATLDSPDQGSTGTPVNSVTYREPDLHFAIERFGSSFDGKISHNNLEITGQWKQSGLSLPLSFKRSSH
jgi:hypothetical protein